MTPTQRLGLAVLIPAGTFVAQTALWDYVSPYAWFLFYPCIFFSALVAGLYGGLLSTAISTTLVWFCFIPPRYSFAVEKPGLFVSIAGFALTGIVFSVFSDRMRRQNLRMAVLEGDNKLNRVLDSAADFTDDDATCELNASMRQI